MNNIADGLLDFLWDLPKFMPTALQHPTSVTHAFIVHGAPYWSKLPKVIFNASSVETFKALIVHPLLV